MQRSLSALLTAILAIPVVGYLTNAQLWAESQSVPAPPLQILLQSPNASDFEQSNIRNRSRDHALQHLELTPEQQAQIRFLQDDAQLNLATLTTQLSIEQDTMASLMANSDTSAADLRIQYQVLQELRQAVAANQFEVLLAVRELLTPEQRTLLSTQTELPLGNGGLLHREERAVEMQPN